MLAPMLLPGRATAIALLGPVGPGPLTDPPPPPVGIFGGEQTEPGAWPAVVAITIGSSLCTGTLVSPTIILTAAHCLENKPDLSSMAVKRGDDINFPVPTFKVAAYGFDPKFCGEKTCKEDIHDYGFLVLAAPQNDILEVPRPVADQDEWDEIMEVMSPVTIVGYGLNEGDITGIKRQVEVPITKFSGSGLEFQAGGDDRDSCQGDSGGPAFAKLSTGEWVLAGITSRGYTCGKGGFYAVPQGGLCWLADESGLDLRPPSCENCDCINTDPDRSEGCGCNTYSSGSAPLALLPLLLLARRRRR